MSAQAPAMRASGLLYRLTRSKSGVAGFIIVIAIIVTTIVSQWTVSKPRADTDHIWEGISGAHLLGTDNAGRDILHQVLLGGGTVIFVGFFAATMTTVIAVALGSLAAYMRGRVDRFLLQLTDVVMTVPQIVLLAVLGFFFQLSSPLLLAVLIGSLTWPILMRSIRAQALTLKEREFVEAAKLLDLGTTRVVFVEIVPNMAGYIFINFIIAVTNAMYALVGLYVLGLAPMEGSNWGIMIHVAWQQGAMSNPNAATYMLAPVAMIAIFQLGLVMMSRSLEEVLNPRLSDG
jgi:peptide/nickel transport system permease protein